MSDNPFLKAIDIIRESGWLQLNSPDPDARGTCISNAVQSATEYEYNRSIRQILNRGCGVEGYDCSAVFAWNDDPSRTEEDVILALKHAAEAWEADQ